MDMRKPLDSVSPLGLKVSVSKVFAGLLAIIAGLIMLHLVTQYMRYGLQSNAVALINLFDVDYESSVPTWFSQELLLMAAVLFAWIAFAKWQSHDRWRWHWGSLAMIFVYLSIDEGAMIHEVLTPVMRRLLGIEADPGIFANAWVLAAAPVVLLVGLLYVRFITTLPGRTRAGLLVAAGLYLSAVLIIELMGSILVLPYMSMTYNGYMVALEEGIEMLGVAVLIRTLLDYLRSMPGLLLTVRE